MSEPKPRGDVSKLPRWAREHIEDLNRAGGSLVCGALIGLIEERFPAVAPGALPLDAPAWDSIDPADPEVAMAAHTAAPTRE